MKALQAAKHACEASGWTISNLQLQKILYFAHMIHLGRTGAPLVDDESFEAWDYGPVLPSVYRQVSGFGSRPIGDIFLGVPDSDDDSERNSVKSAVQKLSNVKPFVLVKILHDERSAWREHYDPLERGRVIPDQSVANEYRRRFEPETA